MCPSLRGPGSVHGVGVTDSASDAQDGADLHLDSPGVAGGPRAPLPSHLANGVTPGIGEGIPGNRWSPSPDPGCLGGVDAGVPMGAHTSNTKSPLPFHGTR